MLDDTDGLGIHPGQFLKNDNCTMSIKELFLVNTQAIRDLSSIANSLTLCTRGAIFVWATLCTYDSNSMR